MSRPYVDNPEWSQYERLQHQHTHLLQRVRKLREAMVREMAGTTRRSTGYWLTVLSENFPEAQEGE